MKLTFSKQAGKFDILLIERDDDSRELIQCPKQGIIPHDMVHYAVERIISRRGFLSRLAGGEIAQFRMSSDAESEAIERLVETMQAELWSGSVSPEGEAVALYHQSCAARSHPCFPVLEEDIEEIRKEIETLTSAWEAVPVHGSLALSL